MGKFWDWHREFAKKEIFRFQFFDDGEGNKDFRMELGGSKFFYKTEIEDKKQCKEVQVIDDFELLE